MDTQTAAIALAGAVSPVIVQLVRMHLLQWGGKAASALSLGLAVVCVAAADFATHQTLSVAGLVPQIGVAFTLQQLVYAGLQDQIRAIGQ